MRHIAAVVLLAAAFGSPALPGSPRAPESEPGPVPDVVDVRTRLPLVFEENRGQTDASVRFLARARTTTAFLLPAEAVFSAACAERDRDGFPVNLRHDVVRMRFEGASAAAEVRGGAPLPGKSHYLLGNDPSKWVRHVPHYAGAGTPGLYDGVDLVWRGDERRIAYDLHVAPGADVSRIAMRFEGARGVSVGDDGTLTVSASHGAWLHAPPRAWEDAPGGRRPVDARFVVRGDGVVGFEVGPRGPALPLVIDPTIVYLTYLGGSTNTASFDELARAVEVDSGGAAYVVGATNATDFPTQSAYQSSHGGGTIDAFVAKINAAGTALVYSTFLGGSGDDGAFDLELGSGGSVIVGGFTYSTNFPTASARQTTLGGNEDGFVLALASSGSSLAFSTYHGGSGYDRLNEVEIDPGGNICASGHTDSTNFPVQQAYQSSRSGGTDAFLSTFANGGVSSLAWSTYLGGTAEDYAGGLEIDSAGARYVAGTTTSTNFPTSSAEQSVHAGRQDVFLTKMSSTGSSLVFSTFLGGAGDDGSRLLAVDSSGCAYVSGATTSTNFPTVSPIQASHAGGPTDLYVAKFAADGASKVYSTYIGGSGTTVTAFSEDSLRATVDSSGRLYLVGSTCSSDFPLRTPLQGTYGGGTRDGFLTIVNAAGSALVLSTFLGGAGDDEVRGIALGSGGRIYFCGQSSSSSLATTGAPQTTFRGGAHDGIAGSIQGGPPDAPGSLTAVNAGSRVRTSWTDASGDETRFEVERATGAGSFARVATTAPDVATWDDASVGAEISYSYRVRAVNDAGPSAWSDVATITSSPPPPANPGIGGVTNRSVRIWWADLATSETGWAVERGVGCPASEFELIGTIGPGATSFLDTTAEPETTYSYRVRALSASGTSDPVTLCITTGPRDPLGLAVRARSDTSVSLSWIDDSDAESGFEIERRAGTGPWQRAGAVGSDLTSFVDTGAAPETRQSWRVRALGASAASAWSGEASLTTPPRAPTGLEAVPLSTVRVLLTWTDLTGVESGYVVRRSVSGKGDPLTIATLPPDATEYLDASAVQETAYDYEVAAFDGNGTSGPATATGIETPLALVLRSARLRAAKTGRKPVPAAVDLRGSFDAGGDVADLASGLVLSVGGTDLPAGPFEAVSGGRLLRFEDATLSVTLRADARRPGAFEIRAMVTGGPASALSPDSELRVTVRGAGFAAAGAITLRGGRFDSRRAVGVLLDPPFHVTAVRARAGRGPKDALTIEASFAAGGDGPDVAPSGRVRFRHFSMQFPGGEFQRRGTRLEYRSTAIGRRSVTLDFARGRATLRLSGIELGDFEKGEIVVPIEVEFGDLRWHDGVRLTSTGRSLRD